MKKWCQHIEWDSDNNDYQHYYWQFNDRINGDTIPVSRNWRVCPICKTERPTKKNIQSDELRFVIKNFYYKNKTITWKNMVDSFSS